MSDVAGTRPSAEAAGALEASGRAAMLEPVPCDLCGSEAQRLLFTAKETREWWHEKCDDDPRLDRDFEFPVVECRDCGHVFVSPRVRQDINRDIYARYWRSAEPARPPADEYASYVCRQLATFRPLGDLLDFGCGWGSQLNEARKVGWRGVGLEVDERKVEFCREHGLEAVHAELLDRAFPAERFDAVVAEQVFEHLYSPRPYLEEIRRLLRPGGVVYIAVPNFCGLGARLARKRWRYLHPVSHVRYFDRAALASLMRSTGFEILKPGYVTRFAQRPVRDACHKAKTFVERELGFYPLGLALYGRRAA